MAEIRVPSERLRVSAREFEEAARVSKSVMDRLDASMADLESEWSGASRQVFHRGFRDWKACMSGLAGMLRQIAVEMRAMADEFDRVDGKQGA